MRQANLPFTHLGVFPNVATKTSAAVKRAITNKGATLMLITLSRGCENVCSLLLLLMQRYGGFGTLPNFSAIIFRFF
jgi:hypothetical protein